LSPKSDQHQAEEIFFAAPVRASPTDETAIFCITLRVIKPNNLTQHVNQLSQE
jgi:hypothetical protein